MIACTGESAYNNSERDRAAVIVLLRGSAGFMHCRHGWAYLRHVYWCVVGGETRFMGPAKAGVTRSTLIRRHSDGLSLIGRAQYYLFGEGVFYSRCRPVHCSTWCFIRYDENREKFGPNRQTVLFFGDYASKVALPK